MVLVLVFFVAPVLFTVWMSLHKWPLLGSPTFNWGSNYTRMLVDARFFSALGFTAYYTIVVTIAALWGFIAFGASLCRRAPVPEAARAAGTARVVP